VRLGRAGRLVYHAAMEREATKLICPVVCESIETVTGELTEAAQAGADLVEWRLDFLTEPPTAQAVQAVLADSPLGMIATCRPVRQGGHWTGSEADRLALLAEVSQCEAVRYVDVEDDVPQADWPAEPERVILSHHDFEHCPADLDAIFDRLEDSPAAVCKVAYACKNPADALRCYDLLARATKPTLALAMGPAGAISRLAARAWGAFGTFALARAGATSAPGQPTLAELRTTYRWADQQAGMELYGVIGCPVGHSMSPAIHNSAFAATGRNALYVPLHIEPGRDDFQRFMAAVTAQPELNFRGLSVTIPHKENALAWVGPEAVDVLSRAIGAINTIVLSGAVPAGLNTDYAAALDALCSSMAIGRSNLAGRAVAVLGAGGAARAIVAALCDCSANVTVYNRTVERAEALAAEFGASAARLGELGSMAAEIVVNCTPVGMAPNVDASPLSPIPESLQVVFDTIYNPLETKLLAGASRRGCVTVGGLAMFVNQAVAQFEAWTGGSAPREVMHRATVDRLSAGQ
jgi:3-dehydroquinate dehydratase / shikimate dehydrogenase